MTNLAGPPRIGLTSLIRALEDAPRRPRLVCHTAHGARTELSGASLANWTAKTAGLLRDDLGLGVGDVAVLRARTGWQVAPVLLGCWWAGLTVAGAPTDDVTADAGPDPFVASGPPGAAVAFVDPGGDADADEVLVLSGHPLGAPATDVAPHQRDFGTAVLPQSDRLGASGASGSSWTAVLGARGPVTAAAMADDAAAAAGLVRQHSDEPSRAVLLSALAWSLPGGVSRTLLAALAADGVLVQCPAGLARGELERIATMEHVTATIGCDVAGRPRVG